MNANRLTAREQEEQDIDRLLYGHSRAKELWERELSVGVTVAIVVLIGVVLGMLVAAIGVAVLTGGTGG